MGCYCHCCRIVYRNTYFVTIGLCERARQYESQVFLERAPSCCMKGNGAWSSAKEYSNAADHNINCIFEMDWLDMRISANKAPRRESCPSCGAGR